MRKVVISFVFLLAISFALAMDDPIKVQAGAGEYVKVYAWTSSGGPLITMDKGDADSAGVFETTFFSLHENVFSLQVMVLKDDEKIKDDRFYNVKTNKGYLVDCTGTNCSLGDLADVVEVVPNETVNDSSNETVESAPATTSSSETVSANTNSTSSSLISGVSVDGKVKILFILGGVLTFLVLIVAYFRFKSLHEFLTGLNYFSEEGELVRLKSEIRKKDSLIKRAQRKKEVEQKIKAAKAQLAVENKKLEAILRKEMNESGEVKKDLFNGQPKKEVKKK